MPIMPPREEPAPDQRVDRHTPWSAAEAVRWAQDVDGSAVTCEPCPGPASAGMEEDEEAPSDSVNFTLTLTLIGGEGGSVFPSTALNRPSRRG